MHLRRLLVLVAFGVAVAPTLAQTVAAAAEAPGTPRAPTPEEIFECFGWVTAQQSGYADFGMSDAELVAFIRGLRSGTRGEEPPGTFDAVAPVAESFLNARAVEVRDRKVAENRTEEQQVLAAADANPAVKKTASGLRYEILAPGSDQKPRLSDIVVAHYTGTFADGTEFDSSRKRGEPLEIPLNNVVEAWQEGMQLIGTGGRIKLYVPSALGYGEFGKGGIPPAKALLFDIELIGVKPAAPSLDLLAPPAPAPTP